MPLILWYLPLSSCSEFSPTPWHDSSLMLPGTPNGFMGSMLPEIECSRASAEQRSNPDPALNTICLYEKFLSLCSRKRHRCARPQFADACGRCPGCDHHRRGPGGSFATTFGT